VSSQQPTLWAFREVRAIVQKQRQQKNNKTKDPLQGSGCTATHILYYNPLLLSSAVIGIRSRAAPGRVDKIPEA
jgi:hypothetical protein